jgi:hypothetical protein
MMREVIRVLRPGGLVICCEWGYYPSIHPEYPPVPAPGVLRFFDVVIQSLGQLGIYPVADIIPNLLAGSGQFDGITPQPYSMPIGPWHADLGGQRIGRAFRAACRRFVEAVRPMLTNVGWSEEALYDIFSGYLHDLHTVPGMVNVYHTVHARKLAL